MRAHFLGVRGSTPAPGSEFIRYGGHTSCLALAHDDADRPTLVLDAGTGLRRIGPLLRGDAFQGTVLLTHLHWDHTHGLPFTGALDRPDAAVHLALPAPLPADEVPPVSAIDVLARGMGPPHFPITPDQLRGAWSFEALDPSTFQAEGFTVTAIEVPHKGGRTFGYRVSDGSTSLAYVPDHGPLALGPGPDGLGERHPAALALAHGVDALVHDAQHTAAELPAVANFGHSAIDYAVDLGHRAGASRTVLFHHHPNRTDDQLDAIAATWESADGSLVTVAHQGLVLYLGQQDHPTG
ncbi:MBL fold metallo-hydrolase [soil metagenome]